MTNSSLSPREVFEQLVSDIAEGRRDQLHLLYAEDAIVDHPNDLPHPSRLVGREALREHFAQGGWLRMSMQASNIVVHETKDPEVIIAEFDYDRELLDNGRKFTTSQIFVMRIRDGLIVESRDYTNPAGFLIRAGMGAELTALVAEGE